jgi:type II secretory pathway pseudopilin PulG
MALPHQRVAPDRPSADDESVKVRLTLSRLSRVLRRSVEDQRGITLVELLTAMAIMMIIISTLAGVFVSGSNAEVDLRNRFEAQTRARVALDKFRREVHNACRVVVSSPAGSRYATITLWRLSAPNPSFTCDPGVASATWCVTGTAGAYSLYRKPGATCDTTGIKWASALVSNGVFALIDPSSKYLPRVDVNLVVDSTPGNTSQRYTLTDAIAIRSHHRS